MIGYTVNSEGGDRKNPKGIGKKSRGIHACLGPSHPLIGNGKIAVKPKGGGVLISGKPWFFLS